jgi:hypothetical protein
MKYPQMLDCLKSRVHQIISNSGQDNCINTHQIYAES